MKLKLNLTDESTSTNVATTSASLNVVGLVANENDTVQLTFTENDIYDLDDIIAAKKRDSDNTPLILKVNSSDGNDITIINNIVKIILTDYGITYSEDETKNTYFAKIVYMVPSFYDVFDVYFNKYYSIYYNQKATLLEGSISISTVLEKIQQIHDNVYEVLNSEATQTYADVENKPKVEYEYGSIDDPTSDVLDLGIDGDRLKLRYDETFYGEGVKLEDIATQVQQTLVTETLKYDMCDCEHFSCKRRLLMKLRKTWDETKCKVAIKNVEV